MAHLSRGSLKIGFGPGPLGLVVVLVVLTVISARLLRVAVVARARGHPEPRRARAAAGAASELVASAVQGPDHRHRSDGAPRPVHRVLVRGDPGQHWGPAGRRDGDRPHHRPGQEPGSPPGLSGLWFWAGG